MKNNVEFPKLKCSSTMNGVLRLHEEDQMVTIMCKTAGILAHADDSALVFNSRDYLITSSKVVCMVMAKWGLAAHARCDGKKT